MEFLETSCIFNFNPKKYKYSVQFVHIGSHIVHSVIYQNEKVDIPEGYFIQDEIHEFPLTIQTIELHPGYVFEQINRNFHNCRISFIHVGLYARPVIQEFEEFWKSILTYVPSQTIQKISCVDKSIPFFPCNSKNSFINLIKSWSEYSTISVLCKKILYRSYPNLYNFCYN